MTQNSVSEHFASFTDQARPPFCRNQHIQEISSHLQNDQSCFDNSHLIPKPSLNPQKNYLIGLSFCSAPEAVFNDPETVAKDDGNGAGWVWGRVLHLHLRLKNYPPYLLHLHLKKAGDGDVESPWRDSTPSPPHLHLKRVEDEESSWR